MAPSHSTPKKCEVTVNQILTLLSSFDNKVLLAYHEYLARQVCSDGVNSELRLHHTAVTQLMAMKIHLQYERNLQNELAYAKGKTK